MRLLFKMRYFGVGCIVAVPLVLIPLIAHAFDPRILDFEEMMRNPEILRDYVEEEERKFDEFMSAREVAQAISVAELCDIKLDEAKVTEFAQEITRGSASAEARMMFEMSGRAHKRRFSNMSRLEQSVACGSALGTAERFDLLSHSKD